MTNRAVAVFFLNGLTLCTYLVQLPALKHRLGLSDALLGLISVLFAGAAITAMQVVGRLVHRFGTVGVLRCTLVAMPLLLVAVGTAGRVGVLALAVTALGAVHGTTDAAMNAYAVAQRRPILNRCHAAWSVSAVLASLVAASAARVGPEYLFYAGGVLLIGGLLLGLWLREATPVDAEPSRTGARGGWTRPLVLLGLSGTLLMICEGAALGWGALLLRDHKHASLGVAALAITAYTAAQTVCRLFGDGLHVRFGAPRIYRLGTGVAAAGLLGAVSAPDAWLGVAGFALMGLGMATLLPLTFSSVGTISTAEDLPWSVARFATFTYGGVLAGPALIGLVAGIAGLPWTLGALAPALLLLGLLSQNFLQAERLHNRSLAR
jgi:MFS family permease